MPSSQALLLLGIQATCASEMRICLFASYQTVHAASDDLSFHFFKRKFNTATKCVQERVQEFNTAKKCVQERVQQDKTFQLKVQFLP